MTKLKNFPEVEEKKLEMPKDLKLRVATKEGAFWIGVKERLEGEIQTSKRQREIDNMTLAFAEEKIKEEKDKEPPV